MAEIIDGKVEIVPSSGLAGPMTQGDMGRYSIRVSDFTPAGAKEDFSVAVPADEKWGDIMLRAAILKRNTWAHCGIPTIIHAIMYADNMGLDIMAGDVYMAQEGRYSTTAGAKIRHAMSSGRIVGYIVDITSGPVKKFKWSARNVPGEIDLPNYTAKVTVHVKDWTTPVVYETTLSEWFHGPNPNWINRPQYMLRRNALSKALEEVAPMGIEADEAPPREGGNLEVKPPMPLPTLANSKALGGISGTGQKANPSTKGLIP
jgi:hypothetical protein